ncbi:hypothetical protein I553_7252 [Mycobacterium xenopi 4042]|uniref:Uncharacterized protein n=1 Tax=Mycobacterium xenopi 4042 TaxID=1299334 RepID=X8E6U5_MYCXE|nr:hypothetical protein I553_7252 [Mycobacterium xenopi 4042]
MGYKRARLAWCGPHRPLATEPRTRRICWAPCWMRSSALWRWRVP